VVLWCSIPEISRLSGCTDWIDLDFVKRQRTPERAMKLGIQLQLAGLSLSNTVSVLEEVGVERSRKAIHELGTKSRVIAHRRPKSESRCG